MAELYPSDVQDLKPGQPEYYEQRWKEERAKIQWVDTGLEQWDGSAQQPAEGDGTPSNPYKIYNAQHLRWVLATPGLGDNRNCILESDLDMGGRLVQGVDHATGESTDETAAGSDIHNWKDVDVYDAFAFDGNGHTIWNLFSKSTGTYPTNNVGFLRHVSNENFVLKNLTLSNSRINGFGGAPYGCRGATLIGNFHSGQVYNCVVDYSAVWGSRLVSAFIASNDPGSGEGLFPDDQAKKVVTDCLVKNSAVYGDNCSCGMFECVWGDLLVERCGVVSSTVIVPGGHSGGFISCCRGNLVVRDCFTNVDVYGNTATGVFVGVTHGADDGKHAHLFENCYAAGKIEGADTVGGFFAYGEGNADVTFKNCYSTSMVGMSDGGSNMGGFVGGAYDRDGRATKLTFTNCYAAGEVGTLKSNENGEALKADGSTVEPTVGGFAGTVEGVLGHADGTTFANCYYDKQTTGSKENAVGNAPYAGITGLLTKSLTQTNPDASAFDLRAGTYPQLKVFTSGNAADWNGNQELANLAKAFSQASASTVFLYPSMNDDSKYDASASDYDTVRRIRYAFPLTNDGMVGDPSLDTAWHYYDDGGRFPNASPVNPDAKIITLSTEADDDTMNDVSVTSVATGIGWLRTESTFGGATGARNLRLVPTTSVAIGKDGKAIVGSDDTVYYQDEANPPSGSVAYQKLSDDLTKADHREGITFIVASSMNLDAYMNDDTVMPEKDKLAKHHIVALAFKDLEGTASEAVADDGGQKTNLDYTVTLKNSAGSDETQVVRLSVAKVIPNTADPDGPGIMSAPLVWDDAGSLQKLFEGERSATQGELGKYVLSYQWMDAAKKTVQAQGTKYLTVVSPLSLVYRTGYGDSATLWTDPGAYQNSDPARADRMPADPTRHGHYFTGWAYERENASGGHDSFEAGTPITAVTDSRGNTNSVIGIMATWAPNMHDLVIKDKKNGAVQETLSTAFGTNLRAALESHIPESTGNGKFLGWRIESGFDGRSDQYVSASDAMPDNDVTVYPVFGTEVSASLTAHNETQGTLDGTKHNRVGDVITYEIAVNNNQPDLVWRNATVNDALETGQDFVPGSIQLIDAEGGVAPLDDSCYNEATKTVAYTIPQDVNTDETYVLMFQVKLNEDAPFVGQGSDRVITNAATVDGEDASGGDVNANTNEVTLPGSAYVEFTPADKWVTKSAANLTDPGASKAQVGDRIRYTLEMGNKSDDPHSRWQNGWFYDSVPQGLQVDSSTIALSYPDPLTPGSMVTASVATAYNEDTGEVAVSVGTLKAGEKAALTFDVIVTADAVGQSVKNTAWAVTTPQEKPNDVPDVPGTTDPASTPDPDDPEPDPTDPVGPGAETVNLSVTKTAGVSQASPGSVVPYTIAVTNTGNAHAKNVVIADTLPEGLEYVSSVPAAQASGSTVTWTCTVPAGMTVTRTVMARVTADASGSLVNDVAVTSPDVEGPVTPPSKPTVDVVPSPDEPVVAVSKVATADAAVTGGQLTYYITVTNSGAQDAAGVLVTDPLPPGLVYASASDGGAYRNGLVSWTVDLPAQSSRQLAVTANVTAKSGELVNTATAVHDGAATVSNYVSTEVTSGAKPKDEPQLSLKKTSSVTQATVGSEIPFTLTLTNTGAGDAKGVALTDALPEGLEYVEGSASPAPESAADNAVTWTVDVPAGQSVTRTLKAKVAATVDAGAKLENAAEASNPAGGDPIVPSELPSIEVVDSSSGGDQPILGISKVASADSVTSGDEIAYTVTVTNTGAADATGVEVSDALPAGLTYQSGGAYDAATGSVTWTVDVPANGSVDCTVTAKVDAKAGTIANTAVAVLGDAQVESEAVSTTVIKDGGEAKAQLSIKKTTSVTEASVGAVIPYVITVTNTGNLAAEGVTVTDTLPAGLDYVSSEPAGAVSADGRTVSWTVDVPAGGEVKRQITAKVTESAATGSQLKNGASVSDPEGGSPITPSVDPPSVDVVDPANEANIAITKVASTDTVVSGSQITYAVTVANAGTADATGVKVTDALPAGTVFAAATDGGALEKGAVAWTVDLAAGESKQLKVTADVTAATGTLVNAAQAAFDGKSVTSEAVSTSVTASGTGGDPAAALSVTKATNVDKAVQGATIDYAITVSNTGDADAKGVTVSDTLPEGLSYVSSDPAGALSADRRTVSWTVDVAAGASVTRIVCVLVTGTQGQSIENSVVVTDPDNPDAPPIDPPDKPVVDVTDSADVSASLTVDRSVAQNGDGLVYTLTLANTGTVDAKGATASVELPSGASFTSASDGGVYASGARAASVQSFDPLSAAASFLGLADRTAKASDKPDAGNVTWTADVPAGAVIVRTVQADVAVDSGLLIATGALTHLEKSTPTNNVQTKVLPESTEEGEPKLSVEKTTTASQVKPGYEVPYTITVKNTGTADAKGATVVDKLPEGLVYQSSAPAGALSGDGRTVIWTTDVPLGSTATFTLVAKVAEGAVGSVKNDVTVTPDGGDPVTPPNPPDVPIVNPDDPDNPEGDAADIGIAKSADATSGAKQGDTVTYSIVVSNSGTADASDVPVSDVLPDGMAFQNASDGGSYDSASRTVSWTVASLAAGTTKTLTLQAKVTASAGSIVNVAQASFDGAAAQSDPVITNVQESDDPAHVPAPSLIVSKTTPVAQAAKGATVPYLVTVRNIGDAVARNVTVVDPLPAGLEYVDSAPKAAVDENGACLWDVSIDPGDSATFSLSAKVTAEAGATVVNSVEARLPNGTTSKPTSDPSIAVTSSGPAASVHIAKHGLRDQAPANGRFAYKLVLTNTGGADAENVFVSDPLPTGTSFIEASDGGSYDPAVGSVSWNVDVPALGRKELVLTVKVDALAGSLKNRASSTYGDAVETTPLVVTPVTDVPTEADPEPAIAKTAVNLTAEREGRADPDDQSTWRDGDELEFAIVAENAKPDSLWIDVVITDALPEGLQLVDGSVQFAAPGQAAAPAGSAYDGIARSLRVEAGGLAGGQSARLTYRTVIRAGLDWSVDATMRNVAQASGYDPDGVNELVVEDSVAVATPEPVSVKELTKTAENLTDPQAPIVQVGDRVRYVITLKNAEPNPRAHWTGAYVYDEIPEGLDVDEATLKLVDADGVSHDIAECYDPGTRQLVVSAGVVKGGSQATVSFEAVVPVDAVGKDLGNVGMAGALLPDPDDPDVPPEPGKPEPGELPNPVKPDGSDDPAPTDPASPNDDSAVRPADPDPSVQKVVKNLTGGENFASGDEVLYTITAENRRPGSLWGGVAITDVLPAGVNIDVRSIRLNGPDGVTVEVDPASYNASSRTLAVSLGDIEGARGYVLSYTARLDFAAGQGDAVNHAMASGSSPGGTGDASNEADAAVKPPIVPWNGSAAAGTGDSLGASVAALALAALVALAVLLAAARARMSALASASSAHARTSSRRGGLRRDRA